MSDTIRKQIIAKIRQYLAAIRRNNAYETDIGQHVYLAQKAQIETPAVIIWPGNETNVREYGIDFHTMEMRVDGIDLFENENPSDISEKMFGDLIEILTGDKWDLDFTSGGTNRPNVGDTIEGATSGAVAIIESWNKATGEWQDGDAAGTFRIRRKIGTFASENLNIGDNLNLATTNGSMAHFEVRALAGDNLVEDILFLQGGAGEYADQGQQSVGASATFNVLYRTETGNPYHQIT